MFVVDEGRVRKFQGHGKKGVIRGIYKGSLIVNKSRRAFKNEFFKVASESVAAVAGTRKACSLFDSTVSFFLRSALTKLE